VSTYGSPAAAVIGTLVGRDVRSGPGW